MSNRRQISGDARPFAAFGGPDIRNVVVGRNSIVWQRLSSRVSFGGRAVETISHRDLPAFEFAPRDRVWVFAYSLDPDENTALLERLRDACVNEVVYVSSSATIIAERVPCYRYPRIKLLAESAARRLTDAKVLTIGLVYEHPGELPAGDNVATSYEELAAFMVAPRWPDDGGRRKFLLRAVRRPFGSRLERGLYQAYGIMMAVVGKRPCLLRPIDLILRAFDMRWYGYVYLSNRAWISMIS